MDLGRLYVWVSILLWGACSLSRILIVRINITPSHAVLGREVVGAHGAAAAVGVQLGGHLGLLQLLQDGREQRPRSLKFVSTDEQALVAVDDVQDEALVGVGQVAFVCLVVAEVQPLSVQTETQARHLVVDLQVDALVGLDADHQFVGGGVQVSSHLGLVQVARYVAELHPDLRTLAVKRLARLQQERHAVPPRVVDEHRHRAKRGAQAASWHGVVIQVARQALAGTLAAPPPVLTYHHVGHGHLLHAAQHLHLLVADVLRVQADRGLHGEQRQDLQQVVLDDVTDDAILVKVPAAPLCAEILTEDDLHVPDIFPVPERLKEQVGKPQDREVLDQLLPEVVVDSVDLLLAQMLVQILAELLEGLAVPAERLLHNHTRPPRL
mmetsp:Transcript_17395/g.52121  ORF Transcript_17395/g.52121 Transcript_17395/m.52121 type:complete len:381 (-) Transcript_17395:766-1908(-)